MDVLMDNAPNWSVITVYKFTVAYTGHQSTECDSYKILQLVCKHNNTYNIIQ